MIIFEILIFLIAFILSITLAFYIPGRVVCQNKFSHSLFVQTALSIVVGMVLWGWQGYIFGYLNARYITYIYLIFFVFLFVKKKYITSIHFKKMSTGSANLFMIFLLFVGVIGQTLPYVQTGFKTPQGLIHTAMNTPDHYWHTSMIHEMEKRVPPYEPGMYGILKRNYHYWFNLVTAELVRVFHLPLLHTQFLGMYVFGSLMLGIMAIVLASYFSTSKVLVSWMLFFFYFGGDASYWIAFLMEKTIDFKVPTIIEEGTIFMDNPPRAFSIIVGLAAIYLLFRYIDRKSVNIFILALLMGTLVGFKVYTGVAFIGGIGSLALYHIFVKRNFTTSLILFLTSVFSAIIFLPVNAKSGGIFFLPFERSRDFITYKPLGFYDFELRWRVYKAHNNYLRQIQLGIQMSVVYLIAQYGTKILGFIPYRKTFNQLGREKLLFFASAIFITIFLGTFFAQKAHLSDSFNFFLPATILLVILLSLHLTNVMEKKNRYISLLIIITVVGLTIPRWVYRMNYTVNKVFFTKPDIMSWNELDSYTFLKDNTPKDSMVLVMNKYSFDSTSAIVSVFSDRNMYLSGQGVIEAHDVVNNERVQTVGRIYVSKRPDEITQLLRKNNISYIYFYGKPFLKVPITTLPVTKVFDNTYATIWKLN